MQNNLERKVVPIPEAEHPPLKIDFDSLLGELRNLESRPVMGEEEVMNILSAINGCSNKNVEEKDDKSYLAKEGKLMATIFNRIMAECGNGEHIQAFLDHYFSINFKKFGEEQSGIAATFSPLTRKIEADTETANNFHPLAMLGELSIYGFSRGLNIIHHEVIHTTQSQFLDEWKKAAKVMAVGMLLLFYSWEKAKNHFDKTVRRDREERILEEAHAYLGSNKLSDSIDNNSYSTKHLHEIFSEHDMQGRPLVENKSEIDRMIASSTAIKRLYVLGISNEEIGELIRKAKWNDKIASYDTLEKKMKELMDKNNLEEEDVDNLVLADDIKRKIYINKVRLIAQEEIKKAFDNISKQIS